MEAPLSSKAGSVHATSLKKRRQGPAHLHAHLMLVSGGRQRQNL